MCFVQSNICAQINRFHLQQMKRKIRRELTLSPLTWKIWRALNNASRWQMGFNSAFKGLDIQTKAL